MSREQKRMKKVQRRRRRKRIFFAFEVVVLLVLIGCLFVYAKLNQTLDKINITPTDDSKIETNDDLQLSKEVLMGYYNVLLVGVDYREDDPSTGSLDACNSDTMILASINNDTKEIKLVSLFRDTLLNVGGREYDKANSAYWSGPEALLTMFNKNLDLDLHDYVTVNFQAVADTVDLLGGIDLDLTAQEIVHLNNYCKDMVVLNEQVEGKEFNPLPEQDGTYHVDGLQALGYCRIRYTSGSDYRRTLRQRTVIMKIAEKAKSASIDQLMDVVDQVFPLVKTNISKDTMLKLGMSMLDYEISDQRGFPFDHLEGEIDVPQRKNALDAVVPVTLENNVIQLHQYLFPDEEYTPSKELKEYSGDLIYLSGWGEDDIPKRSADWDVR